MSRKKVVATYTGTIIVQQLAWCTDKFYQYPENNLITDIKLRG